MIFEKTNPPHYLSRKPDIQEPDVVLRKTSESLVNWNSAALRIHQKVRSSLAKWSYSFFALLRSVAKP